MFSATVAAAIFGFAATAVAQNPYTNQSEPFDLILKSSNSSLNGSYLFPCHEGAAIESLCVLKGESPTNTTFYHLNMTSYLEGEETPSYGAAGVIAWGLPFTGPNNTKGVESEPLILNVDYNTNIAATQFGPYDWEKDNVFISFDSAGKMTITGGNNWYICLLNYAGYNYETLAYVIGTAGAQPDADKDVACTKVDVYREFV
ncbi:hypothetical protein Tdes44962_MAKER03291 [Teratosphaeria destructans]|uniref:DUF7907 domain-containing protein n=1 Tax=Teratosphaeria destructans TaxID=418781 RepID=A0A9W7W1D9_9PEZI|nr:hypothetical protein Tdes44962_MAKER03291 [Teratosphaeria destructans]